ncbi:PAS domain-containing protein [Ferrovibrio terrae]|uniref:PAS domain-containing protein n=1 Tax=Ferrovibrio terrae TaxID=2594003 RepID=UPI003137A5C8
MRDLLLRRQATTVLLQGYEYWDRKRGARSMPARVDLDPIEMKAFLPHVVLMDVLRDHKPGWPLDFRYRLMGSAIDLHMSRRFTGLFMSDLRHQQPDSQIWRNFSEVTQDRQPQFHRVPYVGPHKDFLSVIDLVMPLSTDGEQVDMLISIVDFIPREINPPDRW